MSVSALLLLALGVSMDNFAVSLAIGTGRSVRTIKPMVRLALVFGVFQVLMPLLGWLGGFRVAFFFRGHESWILCGVLAFVGWRMLRSTQESDQGQLISLPTLGATLNLGFATSVDSLVVGFGLAMIHINILQSSGIIGAVTAFVSFAGMLFGGQLGHALGRHSKLSGGLVLMLIGVHALVAR
jgi:manganese efflux pump family protein